MVAWGEGRAVRLIVNADDFGASVAINRGVERACREGIVTSASLMAGGAAFDDAAARLDDFPELGVGVHLTLSAGRAVLEPGAAPTLISPAGALPENAAAFARGFLSGKISSAEVRAELAAQLAKVLGAGVRVTHLDSHQHLHNFSGVAGVVVDLAREFGVRAVRSSRCRLWPPGRRWLSRQLAVRLYAEAFGARARRAGLKMPDGLEGQEWAGALTAERLAATVARLGPGTWELLCHPAAADDADADGYDRAGELAALTSPAVRAVLEEAGVRLVNYAAL
ncbi:MAG TPA: ChbG/HpnK family deacetylase [bacterium]|nr:ChbG/HpnK family deacetylase [bacterium]